MKKYYYITTFIIMLIVSFVGITYSYEYNGDDTIKFELIGPQLLYVDVNTEYKEYGIMVKYHGMDISKQVEIDSNEVDTSKLGNYQVKYSIKTDTGSEYIYREVIVVDMSKPKIELIGGEEVKVLLGGTYVEYGYKVEDNYDKDIQDKVIVSGNVDTSKIGEYQIKYTVSDSSNNKSEAIRKVLVVEPNISLSSNENGIVENKINEKNYSNTIILNEFNSQGIYYEGYTRQDSAVYKIKLKSVDSSLEYTYNMGTVKNNYYSGKLDLTRISNGVYEVYLVGSKEERLINELSTLSRIVRSRVGDKLVSVIYDNDLVSIKIENFKYEYDILIDPGHGGSDIGTSNGVMAEKDLNLMISQYEKCRYEEMGYKVYMIRNDDSYGEMLGSDKIDKLNRRALTIGYYGVVSKIVYSNHHNGSLSSGEHGFEILVGNYDKKEDLILENTLYNKYRDLYDIHDNVMRIYSRDYDTGESYDKLNGKIYDKTNYYAVIRIPYELYNVKNVIYEPIYMTNTNDFDWYYMKKNYIKVSEAKIREYVNLLGGTYKESIKCG